MIPLGAQIGTVPFSITRKVNPHAYTPPPPETSCRAKVFTQTNLCGLCTAQRRTVMMMASGMSRRDLSSIIIGDALLGVLFAPSAPFETRPKGGGVSALSCVLRMYQVYYTYIYTESPCAVNVHVKKTLWRHSCWTL